MQKKQSIPLIDGIIIKSDLAVDAAELRKFNFKENWPKSDLQWVEIFRSEHCLCYFSAERERESPRNRELVYNLRKIAHYYDMVMVRVLLGMKTWQVERSQSIRSEIFETTGDDDKVGIPGIHEKFHWLVFLQNWRHNLLCRPQQHHLRRGVLSFVLKKSGRKISLITMDIVSGPLPCYCYRVSVCLLLWHCDAALR